MADRTLTVQDAIDFLDVAIAIKHKDVTMIFRGAKGRDYLVFDLAIRDPETIGRSQRFYLKVESMGDR